MNEGNEDYIPKGMLLRKVPKDCLDAILERQKQVKIRKRCGTYSMEAAVYDLIRLATKKDSADIQV